MIMKRFRAPKISTVIGKGTQVVGDLHFTGGLHVDGVIRGEVSASADELSTLTVSENGAIHGDVRVANVLLNGTINGDVYVSQRVELAEKARVSGTVYYNMLEMAMGAEINGQLVHSEDLEQRRLEFDGAQEELASEPLPENS